jgi:hypothetical protein
MKNPKSYKVIALSVGARGNKIFQSGDTVLETNFHEGRADELVEKGFLELIPWSGGESVKTAVSTPVTNTTTTPSVSENETAKIVKLIDDISKADIVDDLTKAKVSFDPKASKKVLYEIWSKTSIALEGK